MTVRECVCAREGCETMFAPRDNKQLACSPDCSLERVRQRDRHRKRQPASLEQQRQRQRQPAYRERRRERQQQPAYLERQRERGRLRQQEPAYRERERERKQQPAYLEWERQRARERRRKVNGVMCHHCYGRFRPEGRERYCSVSCRKRGRALCEWDDCTERAIIGGGRITYFCGPEHRELAYREDRALHQMGLSWHEVMDRPSRQAVRGGRPSS